MRCLIPPQAGPSDLTGRQTTSELFDQSERYRHLGIDARAVPLPVNDAEHVALMRAALDRRAEDAERMLREHIGRSANRVLERVFGESATDARPPIQTRKRPRRSPAT
ncbi:MAG: FCD domain-containing protein [Burkholderiales bacterium]|nr:FCD domain-containing protein [Burkholderiales bacterium]